MLGPQRSMSRSPTYNVQNFFCGAKHSTLDVLMNIVEFFYPTPHHFGAMEKKFIVAYGLQNLLLQICQD
jgi:hypothetical protein